MKNLLLVAVFLSGCSLNRGLKIERKKWHYTHWKQHFKDYAFCICLLKGYQDTTVIKRIKLIDKSYFSAINYAVFDSTVQQILMPVVVKMKHDSLESISTVSELGAGKRVFDNCLAFYKSKALDSLTKIESRKWGNIKSIDSLIQKKMPSF